VATVLKHSPFLRKNSNLEQNCIPRFDRSELVIGNLIAKGGFSNIYEIISFRNSERENELLPQPPVGSSRNIDGDRDEEAEQNSKKTVASSCVLKSLKPQLAFSRKKLETGAKDLVLEAHFLSSLQHKHILQVRGVSAAGINGWNCSSASSSTANPEAAAAAAAAAVTLPGPRADAFFLLYDRLPERLHQRIESWRQQQRGERGIGNKETNKRMKMMLSSISSIVSLSPRKSKRELSEKEINFLQERLRIAIDLADAVEYLHSKRIIHRDLKPANIGFDREGTLKLFDFGLAIELPERSNPHLTFNLPGNTGTSRYMAVEVIQDNFYNLKVDVFSFSVILWEILALRKPYKGMSSAKAKRYVADCGGRPTIPRSWPKVLRKTIEQGWTESIRNRLSISQVKEALLHLLCECLLLLLEETAGLLYLLLQHCQHAGLAVHRCCVAGVARLVGHQLLGSGLCN